MASLQNTFLGREKDINRIQFSVTKRCWRGFEDRMYERWQVFSKRDGGQEEPSVGIDPQEGIVLVGAQHGRCRGGRGEKGGPLFLVPGAHCPPHP